MSYLINAFHVYSNIYSSNEYVYMLILTCAILIHKNMYNILMST